MKQRILLFLFALTTLGVSAHSVQTFWEERNDGTIRFWLEHWHGTQSSGLSNFYIYTKTTVNGVVGPQVTVPGSGFVNSTTYGNLPIQGQPQNRQQCSRANQENDWVYYDFAPAACNQPITIQFLAPPPATTTPSCSNLFGYSVTATFYDYTPPTITAPNVTLGADANSCNQGTTSTFPGHSVTDACDSSPMLTYSINGNTLNLPYTFTGTTVVTATATDNSGNTSSSNFNVTVVDNIAPTVVCQDATVQLDASGNASITTADIDNGSNDNCSIASISLDKTAFTCSDIGANTVTLTVTDVNGNASSCLATVTVEDNIAPVAVCQDITVDLDVNGNASIAGADVDNGSTDNCGIVYAVSPNTFTCAELGPNTVTLTVTDQGGNTATCTATVTVVDNVVPIALCQNATVQLDASGAASITTADIDNGSNDACGIANIAVSPSTFGCADVGANTVTLTVTDVNGNSSTCTAAVTVEDNIAPTATCQNVTVQLDVSGNGSISASDVNNGSSDNCGIANISLDKTAFVCGDVGANTVTLTVADVNGNSSSCTSTVTVLDVQPPNPVDDSFTFNDCGSSVTFSIADLTGNDSDPYGETLTVSFIDNPSSGNLVDNNNGTWTFTPGSNVNHTATATYTVKRDDGTVAFQDNGHFYEFVPSAGITWTAAKAAAEARTYNGAQGYLVTITSAAENAFALSKLPGVQGWVGASDEDVEGEWRWKGGPEDGQQFWSGAGTGFPVGGQYSNWGSGEPNNSGGEDYAHFLTNGFWNDYPNSTSTIAGYLVEYGGMPGDCNINSTATAQISFTLNDNIVPTATCQNVTVQLDANGSASISTSDVNDGSSDACGIANLSVSPSSFTCSNVGANTVTLTVTDVNGNSSSCTASVTVEDNIAPTALCQNVTVQLDASGNGSISTSDVNNGSSDNCGFNISLDQTAFVCGDVGANTVTLTVTDVNGNSSSCTSTVTVEDNVAPTAICQDFTEVLPYSGTYTLDPMDIDNGSSDACGIASYTLSQSVFTATDLGANTVYLTVTDNNGNESVCSSTFTLTADPPVVICKDITVQLSAGGTYTMLPGEVNDGSNSPYGVPVTITVAPANFDCAHVGPNTVTLTVSDPYGGVSTCTSTVTVVDVTPPTAVCQDVSVDLDASGQASITSADIDNGSSDVCGVASVSLSQTSFDYSHIGANSVTLAVTDVNGNTSTCVATATVNDVTAPVMVCQDVTVQLNANGQAVITTADMDNGSSDACSAVTLALSQTMFGCNDVGVNSVTLTGVDASGNTSTCLANVTVEDNIAPQAQCQDINLALDGQGVATLTASMIDAGSSDNCSVASMSVSPMSFDCSNLGANTVMLTVTDGSGNVSTCTATVTIEDYVAPVLTCVGSYSYTLTNGTVTIDPQDLVASVTDNCGPVTLSTNISTLDCSQVGTYSVLLTATDAQGNSSSCYVSVSIIDNTQPTAVCQDVVVMLDASGSGSISVSDVNNGSSASCGGTLTYSLSQTSFDCTDIGTNTVTLTVTDGNNNTSSCMANVTVVDNTKPTTLCQSATVVLDANGQGSISVSDVDAGSSDACGIASMSLSQTSFDCSDVGTKNIVLTVTDVNGNSSICTTTVTVIDNTPPVLSCNSPQVAIGHKGSATVIPSQLANANDECGGVTITAVPSSFTCNDVGANTVTVTATDASGNSTTCTSTVMVVDNSTPDLMCQNITVNLDANGIATVSGSDLIASAYGRCGLIDTTLSVSQFDCNDIGINSVMVTVTGANGQTASCTAMVTVVDNNVPQLSCQDVTVSLDASGQVSISGSDLLTGANALCGLIDTSLSVSQFGCNDLGPNQVTVTVTGSNGQTASCTSQVTVIDTISPDIQCQDVSVGLDASGMATISTSDALVSGTDNCAGTTYALSKSSFDCSDLGTQLVTLTATDASGNSEQCTFVVTVSDNIAPSVQCQDLTLSIGTSGSVSIQAADLVASSSDNCVGLTLSLSESNFDCSDIGVNTVTVTATDLSGNTATCTATVTIVDQTAPSMTCPSDITVNNDPSTCGATVTFATPTAVDGCAAATVTQTAGLASGSVFPVGVTTVSFQAADPSGNLSTCSFDVTVTDTEAPVVNSCPGTQSGVITSGQTSVVVPITAPTASDNCPGMTMTSPANLPANNAFGVGVTNLTYVFTDASGNSVSCSFDVVVTDSSAPQVQCPSNITVIAATGQCTAPVIFSDPVVVSLGAGGQPPLVTRDDVTGLSSGDDFPGGTTTLQWTITNPSNGTQSFCSMTVTVIDNQAPVLACPTNLNVSNDLGQCGAVVNYAVPTATDNCSGVTVTQLSGPASGSFFPVGTTSVSYRATDASGNTTQCTFTVTVEDTEAPQLTCPSDITVASTGSSCSALVGYAFPTATDNCPGQVTLTQTGNNSTGTYPVGTTTITFTASDQQGNVSTCSFDITVTPSLTVSLGPDITSCSSANLFAQGTSGGSYQWSTGSNAPSITVNQSGTYSVTVTWPGGCSATDDIDVNITGSPSVSFSGFPTPSFYCLDSPPLPLTGSPAGGTFSGPGISGSNFDPQLSGSGTFTIWYNYTDAAGCSGSASQQVTVLPCDVSLEEEIAFIPKLYPNPTSSKFTLAWEQNVPMEIEVQVVNTLGQMVYSGQQDPMEDHISISTVGWAVGNYAVIVQHADGVEQLRLVVTR